MIWYPYEQMKTMKEPYHIVDADGVLRAVRCTDILPHHR